MSLVPNEKLTTFVFLFHLFHLWGEKERERESKGGGGRQREMNLEIKHD